MYNRVRLTPEQRKRQIINAALDDAIERGPYNISIISVSRRLRNCSKATIKNYYPTLSTLRDAVISEAIESSVEAVIGAAIAMRNSLTDDLPEEQRTKCLNVHMSAD